MERGERLPEFVERVRGWGYRDVRTRQLVTGGQEVCLVALRRKALRRLAASTARVEQRGAEPQAARMSRTVRLRSRISDLRAGGCLR